MSQLSAKLQEKAKIELREDESRKEQSLEQFREWIGKHPFIKNCRTGKIFKSCVPPYFVNSFQMTTFS